MSLHILFQQPGWFVCAKIPGVSVHKQPRFPKEHTIAQRLREQLGQPVQLVHRLDRQTSGCLLVATEPALVTPLAKALAAGQKTYLAFVRGYFPTLEEQKVKTPIKHKGKHLEASSTVRCIARGREPRSSALIVHPHTGRNHQVRRHVRDLHHPILHDGDHGDTRANRWWRENMGLTRLGLHALRIELTMDGTTHRIECPIFADHHRVFSQLEWWSDAVAAEPLLAVEPLVVGEG